MIPLLILGPSSLKMDRVETWAKTTRVRHAYAYTFTENAFIRACTGDVDVTFSYPGDDWEHHPDTFAHIRVGCDVPCPNGVEVIDVEARVQAVQDAVVGVHLRSLRDAAIKRLGRGR